MKKLQSPQERIVSIVKKYCEEDPLNFVIDSVRDYVREDIDNSILKCNKCEINSVRSITKGPANAPVMVIGETVYKEQVGSDKEYVYPLDNAEGYNIFLDAFPYRDDGVFYINTVNCLFEERNIPSKTEVYNCSEYVYRSIDIVRPNLIILMGSIPLNLFKKSPINQSRGGWIDIKGIPAMPTYHPQFILNMDNLKSREITEEYIKLFYRDIKTASKIL